MNEPITQHEQIRGVFEHLTGHPFSDADAQHIAQTMPLAANLITSGASNVDDFLRSVSDEQFAMLLYLAREHLDLVDMEDPTTWDQEFLFSAAVLYEGEFGVDDLTDEELALAAVRLAHLTGVEEDRRNGKFE